MRVVRVEKNVTDQHIQYNQSIIVKVHCNNLRFVEKNIRNMP